MWTNKVEEDNFDAALSYLTLAVGYKQAHLLQKQLKATKRYVHPYKAKDILRASRLVLLPKDNFHVVKDLKKIRDGEKLCPILLVHDGTRLHIADGYHRMCAVYHTSEDLDIQCVFVG